MGLSDIEFDMAEVETANDRVEEGEEDRDRDGYGNGDGNMETEMEMEIWRQDCGRLQREESVELLAEWRKQQEADKREARWRISERRGGRDMIKALEERWRISERRGGREKMKEWGMKWMSKRAEMAGRGLEEF